MILNEIYIICICWHLSYGFEGVNVSISVHPGITSNHNLQLMAGPSWIAIEMQTSQDLAADKQNSLFTWWQRCVDIGSGAGAGFWRFLAGAGVDPYPSFLKQMDYFWIFIQDFHYIDMCESRERL